MHSSVFTIRRGGAPLIGARVTLRFQSGRTASAMTDGRGVAVVEHASQGMAAILVDWELQAERTLPAEVDLHVRSHGG